MSDIETAENLAYSIKDCAGVGMDGDLEFDRDAAVALIEADRAAVRLAAKLEALCEMHHTAMRLRKYGREPEWLGAAFTELRAKYEGPTSKEASDG